MKVQKRSYPLDTLSVWEGKDETHISTFRDKISYRIVSEGRQHVGIISLPALALFLMNLPDETK